MRRPNIKLLQAKLKTAQAEERQWANAWNKAERHMIRIGKEIEELERKIELAGTQQEARADV